MSAAAFIKGLLDLEGSSLTPILVSLVTKNASMLDAFGKVWAAVMTIGCVLLGQGEAALTEKCCYSNLWVEGWQYTCFLQTVACMVLSCA